MRIPPVIAIDFETDRIENRPDFPPEPVGVSIKYPGRKSSYLAWGHPVGNNCDKAQAVAALRKAWRDPRPKLFFNAKFDLAVATEKLGLPPLEWDQVHDAMFLAYLADPHAKKLDLKSLAEDWLDWPPEERDRIAEWVWEHRAELVAMYGGKVTKAKTGPNSPGAWLSKCPGGLVGPYAEGDTDRTEALFVELWPLIADNGMLPAYNRERELLPILMENERVGMRVDLDRLHEETAEYGRVMDFVEGQIRDQLGQPSLNLDADAQFAEALSRAGMVRDDSWVPTAGGEKWLKENPRAGMRDLPWKFRSVSKDNLTPDTFTDPCMAQAMGYRNRLKTCLDMFMRPWLAQAERNNGYITTNWNQVAGPGGGTRTGRPSTSNHNFLNISKDFSGRSDGYLHPEFLGVPDLPLVRKYVMADPGHLFLHRDFSGQEIRVFAHFEQGKLLHTYQENPALDPHTWIMEIIETQTGVVLERTRVKNVTFSRLYGGGLGAIYAQARCKSQAEAKEIANYHDGALPGRRLVVEEITRIVRRGDPIVTWGGRVYFPEPPQLGRSFEYKLINYLVQGSSADITKQCLINWYNHPDRHETSRFLVTVYDEINISAERERAVHQMKVLREAMENIDHLDTPMLTEAKWGENWGELTKGEPT